MIMFGKPGAVRLIHSPPNTLQHSLADCTLFGLRSLNSELNQCIYGTTGNGIPNEIITVRCALG